MKSFKIEEATISQVHEAMKSGLITCRQLVEHYFLRMDAYDQKGPKLNSVIYKNPKALEEADLLDKKFKKEGLTGPLHGIPVLLKDNIDTFDMPTTGGSKSLEANVPESDAFITKKFRQAGALIIAKVNLHEFAIWGETLSSILGQTLNPYDLTRTPGGSSGGTGASVAANFGMVGLGTDTINSVRSPSSANNLVGIRPTIGLVSRGGIIPYSLTQDTAGPICRTVEDAVRVLDVISGYDRDDEETVWSIGRKSDSYITSLKKEGLKEKKIGVLESFFGKDIIHEDTNMAVKNSIDIMKKEGAEVIYINEEINSEHLVKEVSLHLHDLKDHLNIYLSSLSESVLVHSLEEVMESGKYHKGIKENMVKALSLSTGTNEYNKRLIERFKLQTKLMKLMTDNNLDALVYPHQQQLVCKVGDSQKERNGVLGSVTGFPSICVQAGFSTVTKDAPLGVPIGMEILGKPFQESTIIEIAYSFEQVSHFRKEPLSVPRL